MRAKEVLYIDAEHPVVHVERIKNGWKNVEKQSINKSKIHVKGLRRYVYRNTDNGIIYLKANVAFDFTDKERYDSRKKLAHPRE